MIRVLDHLNALGLRGNAAREALRSGKVRIDDVPSADAGRIVDAARIHYDPNRPRIVVGRDVAVVWADPAYVVLWKPPHVLAVPAAGRRDVMNVLQYVGQRHGTALAVHRLDEDTSGLMIVARTNEAQDRMKALFEAHDVERVYLAIVRGVMPETPRVMSTTLVRDRGDGRRGSGPGGKPAVTHLRRLERLGWASLVEARLETGRTHQVRIHLAELEHPVLGDTLYADKATARSAPRLALHAARIAFTHPFTGAKIAFDAPLADDLEILRRSLLEPRGHNRR
jgi:23S rRNA pseudouridine1911/1915/1917 synthase